MATALLIVTLAIKELFEYFASEQGRFGMIVQTRMLRSQIHSHGKMTIATRRASIINASLYCFFSSSSSLISA